ncbi:hypothetical protein K431DRAFT_203480, partial [Polychaeton citri CBS 116435]
ESEWESEQYQAALAHLESLQDKIDHLRGTLLSLVAPLIQPQQSRVHMFAEIKKAAIASTTDLKTFSDSWHSEQTQQLFTRAKESVGKDGDLSRAADVPVYGW